jgi:hypothetical protein
MEVKEIVAAIRAGQAPAIVIETGQPTNPIHVLDLCFLLPALAIVAVLLLRRNKMGFTLAPVVCVVLILISLEVITIVVVTAKRGLASDPTPVAPFGAAGALVTVLLGWYLRPKRKGTEQVRAPEQSQNTRPPLETRYS